MARHDYPDPPSALDHWSQRIQWGMNRAQKSARAVARHVSPDANGESLVAKWLTGRPDGQGNFHPVEKVSVEKIVAAARFLGLHPGWVLFGDDSPYKPGDVPRALPRALVKVLLLAQPPASPVVVAAVTAFMKVQNLDLTEEEWGVVRHEFEGAEQRCALLLRRVRTDRTTDRIDTGRASLSPGKRAEEKNDAAHKHDRHPKR